MIKKKSSTAQYHNIFYGKIVLIHVQVSINYYTNYKVKLTV